ncbi:hypothetical protein K438DRAFT_1784474 [Mycena galopus ATCC 62051]|nr:hypothetical protein K438DRAFT_1784474 [Mycena galopus ATCC 62051]
MPYSLWAKWLAQAILSDGIKMGGRRKQQRRAIKIVTGIQQPLMKRKAWAKRLVPVQNGLCSIWLAPNGLRLRELACRKRHRLGIDNNARQLAIKPRSTAVAVFFFLRPSKMFERIKRLFGFGSTTQPQTQQQYYVYPYDLPPHGLGGFSFLNVHGLMAGILFLGVKGYSIIKQVLVVSGYHPYLPFNGNGVVGGSAGFPQPTFPPVYQPPPYPPPQIYPPAQINTGQPLGAPPTGQEIKEESLSYQWPDGNVKLECTTGREPIGWDDQGWAWRSSGARKQGLPANSFKVDKRICLGVFHCECLSANGDPKRFFRPKKEKMPREKQRSETCHICHSTLTYVPCDASLTYYLYNDDEGVQYSVRQHHGRHEHPRPPIKSLPAADRVALDQQVRENPQLTAQQLRAGAGPTQVPLGDINPILLGSRKARSEVEKSKARQGIIQPAATRNSGFQLLGSLSTLRESFQTPWIVKSDIMDHNFIVMQTPFMREVLLQDQIRSWRDEIMVAEGGRHGVVTDGCHDFFKQGILLISLVLSPVLMRWAPVLFTWMGKLDAAHHKSHFDQLVYAIAEMCTRGLGYEFDERLYSAVLDFSAAQRNGFIDAFVDFMCARIPGWSTLSEQSRTTEAANLRTRAEALIQGCVVHWKRSLHKIKQTIRNQFAYRFEDLVRVLEAVNTSPAEFIQAVECILTEFPEVRPWLSWWILPGNGSMIFPAMRRMPAELQAKLPHSTNAAESGHWLLYRAVGSGFDLFEGIRRLYRFQRETEMLYAAVTGHKPQPKSRIKWHENDGRAPDTRARLAVVEKLEAEFMARNASSTDEGRWLTCNSAPAPPNSTPPTTLMLQSYVWNANSCFIDAPMEAYFRAFITMSAAVRADFLRRIRAEAPKTGLRDVIEHFSLRGTRSGAIVASTPSTSTKRPQKPKLSQKQLVDALLAGQLNVKRLMQTKWEVVEYTYGRASCSRTWLNKMVQTDTTDSVKKYFGVYHSITYSCESKHLTTLPHGRCLPEIGMNINDLLPVQRFVTADAPRPLLDDYLMHTIPRDRIATSRTASSSYHPLHIGPPIPCPNSSCNGAYSSISSISTEWPLLLRVDPMCRSYNPDTDPPIAHPACPLTLHLGPSVEYELIARVIFIPNPSGNPDDIGHYLTKTRLKGKTYLYNDLEREGALIELGPLYLLEEFDADTAYVLYLRISKTSVTTRPVADIQADFERISTQISSPILVAGDSGDEHGTNDEVEQMLIDSITSPTKKTTVPRPSEESVERFYTPDENPHPSPEPNRQEVDQRSLADTNSETVCPVRCHGCGVHKPDGDDIFEEVQCERCKNWSHIECLPSEVDWHAEDVCFICKYCRDADPLVEILWPGRVVMVPDPNAPDWKALGVLWYPTTFIKYHKTSSSAQQYEFRWFECTDSVIYDSKDSILSSDVLRRFFRGREFCEEIEDVALTAEQMGKVRLPFYLRPDHSKHKNPELAKTFKAAITTVAEILANFDICHPVVANFKKTFKGKKPLQRRRGLADWMGTFNLVPTPELEEVLSPPLAALLHHETLSQLSEEDRNERVFGVGSALLQILAVQKEIGEPLNLNGDMLDDLLEDRIVRCPNDSDRALEVMFSATQLPDVKSGEMLQRLLKFKNAHAIYDPQFRPPIFSREAPSMVPSTAPIHVVLKRKKEGKVENEKAAKRRKVSKSEDEPTTSSKRKGGTKGRRTRAKN